MQDGGLINMLELEQMRNVSPDFCSEPPSVVKCFSQIWNCLLLEGCNFVAEEIVHVNKWTKFLLTLSILVASGSPSLNSFWTCQGL